MSLGSFYAVITSTPGRGNWQGMYKEEWSAVLICMPIPEFFLCLYIPTYKLFSLFDTLSPELHNLLNLG